MQLNPQRLPSESQAEYRARRAAENEAVKVALYGRRTFGFPMGMAPQKGRQLPLSTRRAVREKLGKALAKSLKRAKQRERKFNA